MADVFDAVRERAAELGVPGVAVGVLDGDDERHEAYGVTSIEHPLDVTPETRFQIGSITKTFTGTAALLLVERGELDLDRPVREYLPDLRLAEESVAAAVTMRHLLSHTGGWVGDFFDDTGWGEDAAARYVSALAELPQLTPLGELWSYNNAGFAIAGRVLETVAGQPYEAVVEELVLRPNELTETTFWPWEVMTERFAVGHEGEGDELKVARPWPVGRSAHAAGGLVSTTPDLLRYARLHLDPPAALRPMQERVAETAGPGEWVGLTWYGEDRFGTIRHGGGTNGQISLLVLVPARRFAAAILTNHSPLGTQVVDAALRALELAPPDPEPIDVDNLDEYVGTYEMPLVRITLSRDDGALRVEMQDLGGFPRRDSPPGPSPPPATARFVDRDRWRIFGGTLDRMEGRFLRHGNGDIAWLRVSGRLHRRVE